MVEMLLAATLVAFGGLGIAYAVELTPLARLPWKPFSCAPCRTVWGCIAIAALLLTDSTFEVSPLQLLVAVAAGIGGALHLMTETM